jgi:subtilase family serine protease
MAWSNSGGCVSAYEAKPDYQINFGLDYLRRGHPDVAFHTMVEIFWRFSKYSATGTSVGTPCWAALIALANQGRCTPLTDAHQVLYSLAGTQLNFNPYGFFRDITEGNNGDHYAGPGHDLVTGLGAPVADRLIPALRGNTLLPILYFLLLLD